MNGYPYHIEGYCLTCKKWIPKSSKLVTPFCVRNRNIPHFDFQFNSYWFECQNWCLCDFEVETINKKPPKQEDTFLAKVKKKSKKGKIKNGKS